MKIVSRFWISTVLYRKFGWWFVLTSGVILHFSHNTMAAKHNLYDIQLCHHKNNKNSKAKSSKQEPVETAHNLRQVFKY